MKKLINKLESTIYTKLIENDIGVEEDIFNYGFLVLIRYLIYILIMLPLLITFGLVKPVFVFCISYFILRNHVGGVHVANPLLCVLTTVFITILVPWISANNIIHSFRIICIMYAITIFSIYIIKVADHPNKPLSSEEKNQHSKNAIVIILFEFLVFLFSYKNSSKLIFNEILFANLVCTLELYVFCITKAKTKIISHKSINK